QFSSLLMAITVISVQLSPEQQKVLDSLNPRQRRIYDATPGKVDFLEGILEDRKKSEVGWELMSLSIYTITTIVVTFVNARYFNSEDSTKTFVIIINSVYYGIKSIIVGIKNCYCDFIGNFRRITNNHKFFRKCWAGDVEVRHSIDWSLIQRFGHY
ncbi:3048_t:CDS:2, partial [Funneliformis caledonium]